MVLRALNSEALDDRWHLHRELELVLILSGRGSRLVGDSVGAFAEGDLVLIGADTPHRWLVESFPGEPAQALVVLFRPDLFGPGFWELGTSQSLLELLERAKQGINVRGKAREAAGRALQELAGEAASPLVQMARLLSILALVVDSTELELLSLVPRGRAPSSRRAPSVQRMLDHIHENATRHISQREMAERVGLSPASFSRYFVREVGKPFMDYVIEVRVGQACQLLLEDQRPIGQVALAAGFNNLANFNRRFRSLKSMTPSAYRRLARGT